MSVPVILADACPVCHPGIPDASPPLASESVNGGLLTVHQCGGCYARWRTWRTPDGWPVERRLEPVSVEEATVNAEILRFALDEQDREARYAVA